MRPPSDFSLLSSTQIRIVLDGGRGLYGILLL
jgi:hypothetical protein